MRVTIIADASFCPEHRVAGYGYWIACERGKLPGGGPMRDKVSSSMLAEMMAVCNALLDGFKHKLIEAGDEVLIQTDCMGAIELLQATPKCPVTDVFHSLCKRGKITVRFKHVKGHTAHAEPRFAANRACDQRAKTAMRARRKAEQG